MSVTIRQLETAAQIHGRIIDRRVANEISYLIAGAIENAPNSEADQISTLETSLSFCDDQAVREWFVAQGFKW
jgi:hypothetical protein